MSQGRVLEVCPRYPPHRGGVERHVSEIAEYVASKGWEVLVFTTQPGRGGPCEEELNGVLVRRFPAFAPGEAYFVSAAMRRALRLAHDFDLIHAHSVHALPSYYALATGTSRKVLSPYFHGTGHTVMRRALHRLYQPLYARRLPNLRHIVFASNAEAKLFGSRFPASGIIPSRVIPSGVDLALIQRAAPKDLGGKVILACGRLERYKRLEVVIRVLDWLPREFRVHIVGSGPQERALRRLAERIDPTRVSFHAQLDDETLFGMYKGCWAYVNLSEKEAFGLTVLEAMAAGAPVLVYKSMALSEFADRFPLHVRATETLNPREIAADLQDMRRRPPPDLTAFDWSQVGAAHEKLYQEVLSS